MTPRVAILPWGDAIEDFLEPLGLSLAQLRDELAGGWLFGYVEALGSAGVEATVVCCARGVREVERWRHGPTGAPLVVLPLAGAGRWARGRLPPPYASYLATPPLRLGREARRAGWRALLVQEYDYPRYDVCAALGRVLGIPVFATHQGGSAPWTRVERLARPLTVRAGAGFVIASQAEADRARTAYGIPPGRIAALPNPLDVDQWALPRDPGVRAALGLPDDAVVVAWHGRVDMHAKGLDVLADAWRRLAAPGRHLLLIGAGPDADALRDRVRDLDGVVRVDRYVLDKAEVARLLGAADLYAFPSRHEGFPVAPLEAMASGLPLVAADAPGIAEILPAGRESGGVVVEREPAAFAAALGALIEDAEERRRLGARGRSRVAEAFSLEAVGAGLRGLLLG